MGLYKPAKQLQMARDNMDSFLLRPGELHIVMAELRSIGAYIDYIELTCHGLSWTCNCKQILNGSHIAKGLAAHVVSLEALFNLYQEAFFEQHLELQDSLKETAVKNLTKHLKIATKMKNNTGMQTC